MSKVKTIEEAVALIQDGMTVMIGGFLGVGTPHAIIDKMIDKGVKDLIVICTDTAYADHGIGKLISKKMVKKVIASHIGTNSETGRQMNAGEIEVLLTPQGTLAEQIRSGGAGLGGFLTPTGIGTVVEENKRKIEIDGREYILELPLKADIALLKGAKVDKKGNIYYDLAARNFNPVMATAADTVIVEADYIVEAGEINANDVMTPGIFVDVITRGDE